jgi:hypothetical protein
MIGRSVFGSGNRPQSSIGSKVLLTSARARCDP